MNRLQISLAYWCVSLATCACALAVLEVVFRSEIIWDLPQGVVLAAANDMEIRSTWRSYQPAAPADRHVLLLGASTACASMELPADGTSALLSKALGATVEFRALCAGRASFADYLAYLENGLAHGFRPDLVLAYTWPGMLTAESIEKSTSHTEYMPLISDTWLQTLERQKRTGYAPGSNGWWLRNAAIVRHRYYVNSWVRQRFDRALRGRFALTIQFDENRYRRPRVRPLETDTDRFERTRELRTRFVPGAATESGLVALLERLEQLQVPTVLMEAPWSPPVRTLLEPIQDPYSVVITNLARQHRARYMNVNDLVLLSAEDFADLYHVSWDGRMRWLTPLIPWLVKQLA